MKFEGNPSNKPNTSENGSRFFNNIRARVAGAALFLAGGAIAGNEFHKANTSENGEQALVDFTVPGEPYQEEVPSTVEAQASPLTLEDLRNIEHLNHGQLREAGRLLGRSFIESGRINSFHGDSFAYQEALDTRMAELNRHVQQNEYGYVYRGADEVLHEAINEARNAQQPEKAVELSHYLFEVVGFTD